MQKLIFLNTGFIHRFLFWKGLKELSRVRATCRWRFSFAPANMVVQRITSVGPLAGPKDRFAFSRAFRAVLLEIACFLGRRPRLSHFAALRQDAAATPAEVTE